MSFCFVAIADIGSELLELSTALSYWGYIFKTGRRNPLILELFTPLPLQYLISERRDDNFGIYSCFCIM